MVDRHAALAHSFHAASTTEFHLPRSSIEPPDHLASLVFPFIDDGSGRRVQEVRTVFYIKSGSTNIALYSIMTFVCFGVAMGAMAR